MDSRKCAVSGSFYPSNAEELKYAVSGFFANVKLMHKNKTSVIVAPHAGYGYSGQTAAYAYSVLNSAETFVILCPNHTGLGSAVSISSSAQWETPLGNLQVDAQFADALADALRIERDDLAHLQEHAIEVQLPFIIRKFGNKVKIVPICLAIDDFNSLIKVGQAISEIQAKTKTKICVIASSDFSHFIPLESAKEKDSEAIEEIKKLDVSAFYKLVHSRRLSICGYGAIIAAVKYAKEKGMERAEFLRYSTSADATRDRSSVVGYAALAFY
ncbi:MAG: MEMO1 family protein [Candidatus Diapherotrites archaeon]|nr:MEMO1 family protein [Candidatus Diapherotrites archaeon]